MTNNILKKIKRIIVLSIYLFFATIAFSQESPAFPGAEGHGRYTQGGRGGRIVRVTNLKDSGTGSLRAAVTGNQKKIVVFDVGGTIELNSELRIGANTTIAGQTAPGQGITIRYYSVVPNGDNIIMRFIRVRRGQERDISDADAIGARHYHNHIYDHCSFSWSIDEVASFYDNVDFTMQWCTVGEALTNSGHSKGAHGFGGIWGGKCASFHHNLLVHLNNRVPRLCGARYNWDGYDKNKYENSVQAERVDLRNNVFYNWGTGNGAYGGAGGYHNIINNYYKAGPATKNKTRVFQCSINNSADSDGALPDGLPGRYYINGNYVFAAGSAAENYDWKGVIQDSGRGITVKANGESTYFDEMGLYGPENETIPIRLEEPIASGDITTHEAKNAFGKVIAFAGASLVRDEIDTRYANEAKNGTATYKGSVTLLDGIIDLVEDVGGCPSLPYSTRPSGFDTDHDGIPDSWENSNGLNPNDGNDALLTTIDPRGWYSNIEVYINSLVQDLMISENEDAQTGFTEYYPPYRAEDGSLVNSIKRTSDENYGVNDIHYYNLQGICSINPPKGIVIMTPKKNTGKSRKYVNRVLNQ